MSFSFMLMNYSACITPKQPEITCFRDSLPHFSLFFHIFVHISCNFPQFSKISIHFAHFGPLLLHKTSNSHKTSASNSKNNAKSPPNHHFSFSPTKNSLNLFPHIIICGDFDIYKILSCRSLYIFIL